MGTLIKLIVEFKNRRRRKKWVCTLVSYAIRYSTESVIWKDISRHTMVKKNLHVIIVENSSGIIEASGAIQKRSMTSAGQNGRLVSKDLMYQHTLRPQTIIFVRTLRNMFDSIFEGGLILYSDF